MITTNTNKKFKERDPLKTIQIIQNFFTTHGYEIKIVENIQSEAGTFSCGLMLYKNGNKILHSCGKGMTEEYSLASGHAELYERFANRCNFVRSPFFMDKRSNFIYDQYGYYTRQGEKILSYDDIMQYPMYNIFYKKLLKTRPQIETHWKLITCNKIIGEPFYDLTNNNTIVYHNQQIANRVTCSVGMSAGNTIEEALNQGISEICEHIITDKFFVDEQSEYYVIDPLSLNDELQDKIKNIENCGLKFYLFDLSYNFKMPVMMALIVNPFTQTTTVNFGSFPIFDIAAERVITEIYQNVESFIYGNKLMLGIQDPYLARDKSSFNQRKNSAAESNTFDEKLLLNKIKIVSYNTEIFLSSNKNISNKELNQYFISLFQTFNYSIHYIDNSLCKEIKAIYILVPEYDYTYQDFEQYNTYPSDFFPSSLMTIMKRHKLANEILFNNQATASELFNRFQQIQSTERSPSYDGLWDGTLTFVDWINPIPVVNTFITFIAFENQQFDFQNPFADFYNTIFFKPLRTFATLRSYVSCQQYTKEEIIEIMHNIFNVQCTIEDINKCFDMEYIFQKAIVETTRNYYNSTDYEELVKSTIYISQEETNE